MQVKTFFRYQISQYKRWVYYNSLVPPTIKVVVDVFTWLLSIVNTLLLSMVATSRCCKRFLLRGCRRQSVPARSGAPQFAPCASVVERPRNGIPYQMPYPARDMRVRQGKGLSAHSTMLQYREALKTPVAEEAKRVDIVSSKCQ